MAGEETEGEGWERTDDLQELPLGTAAPPKGTGDCLLHGPRGKCQGEGKGEGKGEHLALFSWLGLRYDALIHISETVGLVPEHLAQ